MEVRHKQFIDLSRFDIENTNRIIMKTVYLKGKEMHVNGLPETGEKAKDFTLVGQDLSEIKLDSFRGQRLVLNIFPSLDTDVCAASVRRFNADASKYPDTKILCVSMDLPFAASRFCTVNGIENVSTGSGFRSRFGEDYGVKIEDGPMKGLFARALVVIDENGTILGTSLCEQITDEPDYEFVKRLLC